MKNSKKTQAADKQVQIRLKPQTDGFVLDFRNLTLENQELLADNILSLLSPAEKANVFILCSDN